MGICASAVDADVPSGQEKIVGKDGQVVTVNPKKDNDAAAATAAANTQKQAPAQQSNTQGQSASSSTSAATPNTQAQGTGPSPRISNVKAEDVEVKIIETGTSSIEVAKYLKNVPVLAKLTDDDRTILANSLQPKQYSAGTTIVSDGEDANEFFIIKKGTALVKKFDANVGKEVVRGKLGPGEYFGETALLSEVKRTATIEAEDDVIALTLDRHKFSDLFSKKKLNVTFAKRVAISSEAHDQTEEEAKSHSNIAKTAEKRQLVLDAVRQNMLFKNLEESQQLLVVDQMWLQDVKMGQSIIKQGELGDNFYVVDSGEFEIYKDNVKVAHRGAGSSFGELALMYNAPRAATVQAKVDCKVWVMDRRTYRHLLSAANDKKLKEYESFLKTVQLLAPLTEYERSRIAEALEEANYPIGHKIVTQGEDGDTFFILKQGECVCTRVEEPSKPAREVRRYVRGEFFGERALVMNQPRAATVTSVAPVQVLYLKREAFSQLLGPLDDILKRSAESYKVAEQKKIDAANVSADEKATNKTYDIPLEQRNLFNKYKLADFKVIGTLGKGSFGHVQLVKSPAAKTHALKSVNKAQIVQLGQQEHIMNEKKVMAELDHPFLVRLEGTHKDKNHLYFLLEPALGGELFSVLRQKTFFDEDTARFFAAGVVLAFEYMHSKDIIYRDLKPENLLLDEMGYLKITDFGFAKKVKDRTWTLCGTPDYLAPEVVSGQGHGKGVDWWTLGILIYEMLASYPPFYDEDPMKTYAKIMHGHIAFPLHFSKSAIDLIKGLLHLKPTKRLGVIKGGATMIKQHAWFKGFDWDAFFNKKLQAPIRNPISSSEDLSNFDKYPDEDNTGEEYVPDPKNPDWDAEF